MQYTIRNISAALDDRLRKRAAEERRSLNETVVRILTEALGLSITVAPRRDVSKVAGTWKDDPVFDRALLDQDTVDADLWK
jgi:hypothetical protein